MKRRPPSRAMLIGVGVVALVVVGVGLAWWSRGAPDGDRAEVTPTAASGTLASTLPGGGWRETPVRELPRLTVDDATAAPLVRPSPECEGLRNFERQLVLQNQSLVRAFREVAEHDDPPSRLVRVTRVTAEFGDAAGAEVGLTAARAAFSERTVLECLNQGAAARGHTVRLNAASFPGASTDDVTLGLHLVAPDGPVAEEYVAWWRDGAALRSLTVAVTGPPLTSDALLALIVAARGPRQ